MMAELPIIYMRFNDDKGRNSQSNNAPENSLSGASYESGRSLVTSKTLTVTKYVRFPEIHNKGPDVFQSLTVSPLVNHSAVPSW